MGFADYISADGAYDLAQAWQDTRFWTLSRPWDKLREHNSCGKKQLLAGALLLLPPRMVKALMLRVTPGDKPNVCRLRRKLAQAGSDQILEPGLIMDQQWRNLLRLRLGQRLGRECCGHGQGRLRGTGRPR
ncbi:hypothetical protein LEL_00589 [Akanthomyces lecanii RCEF 1005]|uniref:Uncharacterized protein n=1 Tax=Akanthomyces lecanii RCEF 1005 TaxID=1081108 RepID=A0A168JZ50_CORDF|nr:hypothetical protein LEL_00589 [Akanthomyces lecanii RCEF 1005]